MSAFPDLLNPASVAAHETAADAERRAEVLRTIARLEAARAKILAEFPDCSERDAVLAVTDADLERLRAERDAGA